MAKQGNTLQDQINLVGEGTTFEGTLRAESDVRASGRIVGKLEVSGKAIIAEGGRVEGEINATNADIAGHVQGEVFIEERLVLKSTAHVDGNIVTDRLVVEEGAVFTGECKMGEAAKNATANGAASSSGSSASKSASTASKGGSSSSGSRTSGTGKSGSGSSGSGSSGSGASGSSSSGSGSSSKAKAKKS